MKTTIIAIAVSLGVLLICAALPGCGGQKTKSDKPQVVATTTMIADAARIIGGDDIDVISIMRDGEDPHIYEPKPLDATRIASADLVLFNGLHLEATLAHIIEDKAKGHIVALAEHDDITPISGSAGTAAAPDPHCWMDVKLFMLYVEGIRDALIKIDPEHAENYRERTTAYLAELEALDMRVHEQLAEIPQERRVIITSHDAFNYYAAAYDVEVHGVVGISTEQQPTPQQVEDLKSLVRDRGVRALFIETSTSDVLNQIIRNIADITDTQVGGTLYSDSLGAPGEDGETYIGMIEHNTQTVVDALR